MPLQIRVSSVMEFSSFGGSNYVVTFSGKNQQTQIKENCCVLQKDMKGPLKMPKSGIF